MAQYIQCRRMFFLMLFSVIAGALVSTIQPAFGDDSPILYLFWGDGCPHCEEEKEFLEIVKQEYPQVEMRWFEVWNHPEFAKLADAMCKAYNTKASSVPMTFLGDWSQVGFLSFETTGVDITQQIECCLQQGCPDALDRLGSQEIASRIKDEAAQNTPNGWELHLASSVEEESSNNMTSPAPQPAEKVIVYYFHGNYRCPSCITIEQFTEEVVLEAFSSELKSGLLEFKSINAETPEHRHFIKDYQLYTRSVIVSHVVNGQESRWKNLERIWELFVNEKAFKDYIEEEVAVYLKEKES